MPHNLITILGTTAVGKTKLAAKLAYHFNGEIISADSRQVYKGMNIGTGKDYDDYFVEGIQIPFHLIDIMEPYEEFNLFLFKKYFNKIYSEILSRNNLPFLAGGSGLYLSSIIQNYKLKELDLKPEELEVLDFKELKKKLMKLNPSLHNTTDLLDKERTIKAILIEISKEDVIENEIEINHLIIGVRFERNEIKKRIKERLIKRFDEGMIEEVKNLVQSGLNYDKLNLFGLEYRYIGLYLQGKLNYNDMLQKLNSAINSFAKRQMTWFRKMERESVKINWIDGADYNAAKKLIEG